KRVPALEDGLALVSQLTLVLSMKARAEKSAGPAALPEPGNANLDFLLGRGTVALLRSQGDRLSEVSLTTRSTATVAALIGIIKQPAQWAQFVPTVKRSRDAGTEGGVPSVELEQVLPPLSFQTTYGVRASGSSVDMLGISGDLRDARVRWDVGPAQ